MSISYSTPSQRYSILDRVVGAFGGMGSERPRTLVIRPEPSPVGWDLGPVAAPSMMIVQIRATSVSHSGDPAPSAGMRLEVPILERAGIASMARYSTLRAASASRKALSHADTSSGDPIAPSASWVASCPNMIDGRPSLGPRKGLGLPSAHCTLAISINHDNNSYWDLGQTKRIAVSTEHPEKNNARSAGSASLVSPLPHGPC
ncbi:hypothetical protein BO83DRAFT_410287 [Aspergillus eucalypticola CBS 122712]|uniref:Uncharacterized protein n=1 Tax=Aspergillus eucalypticola (strain CBS 122712 / IBT 29274) TaxID=1448314 RepID=A0A317UY09_ASPEC|nr:uncharacterized protein BO83DRAFT_410287 [Aspergillus eucalypticola CBS 122712]PWY66933.1 hypothetical protein BO83DRAFT_410287 [Aspergillus eucalypticola CBS 122712]